MPKEGKSYLILEKYISLKDADQVIKCLGIFTKHMAEEIVRERQEAIKHNEYTIKSLEKTKDSHGKKFNYILDRGDPLGELQYIIEVYPLVKNEKTNFNFYI